LPFQLHFFPGYFFFAYVVITYYSLQF
jgi:hypothetical protein